MLGDHLLTELRGSVLLLTLNRPERLNAWTFELGDDYFAALDAAEIDPRVRVVVVTGAGRGFCAGLDLDTLAAAAGDGVRRSPADGRRMTHAQQFRKPLIGAINGPCAGFGLVQALACDVLFASRSSFFVPAFAQRGLNAEYGTSWLLPRMIGQMRASEWLMSGRRMAAEEAERVGLVNRVFAGHELLEQTLSYGDRLARTASPIALVDTKAQIAGDWLRDLVAAEDHAKSLGLSPGHRVDFAEGVESFRAGREPRFAPLPVLPEASTSKEI